MVNIQVETLHEWHKSYLKGQPANLTHQKLVMGNTTKPVKYNNKLQQQDWSCKLGAWS